MDVFGLGALSANTTAPSFASGFPAFSSAAFFAISFIMENFAISDVTDIAGCATASAFPTGVYGFFGIDISAVGILLPVSFLLLE